MEALPVPRLHEYTRLWDLALSGLLQRGKVLGGSGCSGLHLFIHREPWAAQTCHTGPVTSPCVHTEHALKGHLSSPLWYQIV